MKLNEDWLATFIGLGIVAVIGLGLLGPGPQRATLKPVPQEPRIQIVLKTDPAIRWPLLKLFG